jgi:hypothetical protein
VREKKSRGNDVAFLLLAKKGLFLYDVRASERGCGYGLRLAHTTIIKEQHGKEINKID